MKKAKRIIVTFDENRKLDTFPYVLNIIRMLASDFKIDFFVPEKIYQEMDIDNLTLIKSPHRNYAKSCINFLIKNGKNYDFMLTFSMEGLWALLFNNLIPFRKKLKCAYFSMEFSDKVKAIPKKYAYLWNLFRKNLKKYVAFSVVQDKFRASAIREYFDFVDKIYLVPNSYIGFTKEKSDFAYKKFSISTDKKILLYTGSIEEWGVDINLPKHLKPLLDKDFVLIFSGFSRDNYAEVVKKEYSDLIEQKKFILSTEELNENDYTELVKSSLIGLAWYKEIDISEMNSLVKNIYYMGLSSGKLCKYLSCAVPVILPEFYYGYKELTEKNNIGKAAVYDESIVEKIMEIDSNYDFYRKNIETYYNEEMEYSKKAKVVTDEITKILNQP